MTGVPQLEVVVRTDAKHWLRSKTMWVNIGVASFALAEVNFHLLQPLLPVNVFQVIAFALPIVNLVLRSITNKGLTR